MTELVEARVSAATPPALGEQPRPSPLLVGAVAAILLVIATVMMLRRVEPFVNWFYISAWYPTLLILDAAVAARTGRYYLLSRPRFAISLLGWSAVLWFFFELINFRVANWYYVFLPPQRGLRWFGTTISFMTVLPAIFLAERWLTARGAFDALRWPGFDVRPQLLRGIWLTGVAFAALSLIWPRLFFPLIWGALTLLLEPWNYSRDPARSLIGDLSAGRPGRLLRFVTGGLAIGFIWELYNIESRSKWIYTVPGFEDLKLFEMPLLGFGGFPIFALDCFVVYQSLVLLGIAIPASVGSSPAFSGLRTKRMLVAVPAAIAFSLAILFGMDRWTTDSLRPGLDELWVLAPAARQQLAVTPYQDLFALSSAQPADVAQAANVDLEKAREWVAAAELVSFRGIGTTNGRLLWEAGIRSLPALAAADHRSLAADLQSMKERPRAATLAKVRVWVRAAQRAVEARS
jgi:hypothetical protein